ncbi:MAG: hypothetical protein ACJ8G3_10680 [Burkholderiaceae bacterium]
MKKQSRNLLVLTVAAASLSAMSLPARSNDNDNDDDARGLQLVIREVEATASQVKRGFDLVPTGVHLNMTGKNRALVGLGSYVVNTSGCVDCHTHPSYMIGGDPYLGQREMINAQDYMTGGRMFGPVLTAPNLTPDSSGKPAGLTRAQFITTLRTGHNPNDPPEHILQVMPWPTFGKKTDLDLSAIYEYLRALPSLPDNQHPGP